MEPPESPAIARLAETERAALLAFARRRLGTRGDEAEDVVQEALLKAVRALQGGTRPHDLRAWTFTIVARCCADAHAGAARRATCALPEGVELADAAPGTAQTVEARAEVAAAVRSIASLPAAQRDALVGFELGGETYGELGARHGWSIAATKSLLWRARTRLAEERAEWAQVAGTPLLWLRGLAAHAERPLALIPAAPWGAGAAAALGVAAIGLPAVAPSAAPAERPALVAQAPAARATAAGATVTVRHAGAPARTARIVLPRSDDPAAAVAACVAGTPLAHRFTPAALLRARRDLPADAAEYSSCATTLDRSLARGG